MCDLLKNWIDYTLHRLNGLIKSLPGSASLPSPLIIATLALCLGFTVSRLVLAGQDGPRFIRFEEVQDIIAACAESDGGGLGGGRRESAWGWNAWIRAQD